MNKLEIRNVTRGITPRIPFARIGKHILGSRYELSLVLCGDALAKKMNARYRNKTYKANVLSFPLSKTEGEIFLNVRAGAREAKRYGVSLRARLTLLFAHACLHLKGMKHGKRMEQAEEAAVKRFGSR